MRYLYGDSTPFPLGFNFLLTLEAFMTAATRVVQLEHESQALTRQTEEAGQGRMRGLEALEQFHNVVMKAVQDTAQRVQHAHALEYARTMADFAGRYVEEHRRSVQSSADRELAGCRTENERRVIEQRALVETFLKTAKLPVVGARVTMNMTVVMWAGTRVRSTSTTSSSPAPSPVRLSPWCWIEPSLERSCP